MNNAQSGRGAAAQQREQAIGDYITACNAGDAEAVAATCTPDAVHYFPARMYGDDEPVRGGRAIGQKWPGRSDRSAHAGASTARSCATLATIRRPSGLPLSR